MTNSPILANASREELGVAVEENLNALFRSMMALPGSELVEREGLSYHHAPPSNPMFKGVWNTDLPPDEVDAAIRLTLPWFQARKAPFLFWWVSSRSQPSGLRERLEANGFEVNIEGDPGMAVELEYLNENVRAPEGFRLVHAQSPKEIEDWGDTFVKAFEIPAWAGQAWVDATTRLGADKAPWKLYVGYLNSTPVSTTILFLGGGVASEYGVGTLAQARGQGIGAVTTLLPLLEARELGYQYGVLFATEMGHPVYRRLGFQDVGYTVGRYLWVNPER